jgi:hypothetical protein
MEGGRSATGNLTGVALARPGPRLVQVHHHAQQRRNVSKRLATYAYLISARLIHPSMGAGPCDQQRSMARCGAALTVTDRDGPTAAGWLSSSNLSVPSPQEVGCGNHGWTRSSGHPFYVGCSNPLRPDQA